jgi:O-antigen ligase
MKTKEYLIYLLPAAIVTGPLVSEMIIILSSLNIIYLSIKNNLTYLYKNNFTYIFFFFYLIINLSSLFSTETIFALKTTIPYFRYFFLIISIVYCIKTVNMFLYKFLISLSITLVFVSLSGYAEYFFDISFSLNDNFIKNGHRLSGFFGDELIIGSYLSRLLPLLILLILITKRYNVFFSLIILFIYFIIFLSGERSALFIGTISLISYIFFSPIKLIQKISLFLIGILLIILIFKYDKTINNRIINETANQIYNNKKIHFFSKEHTSHYKTALKMFIDKPFLGNGPKTFRLKCSDFKFYENSYSCTTHPHNFLLQLLAEIGILGFGILIVFFYSLFFFIKNLSYTLTEASFYYLPLIIISFPLIPNGNFFNNWLSIINYLSISVSLYYISNYGKKN